MIINRLLLASVIPATTADDSRYFLNAIRLENGGPNVAAIATNGHVLIKASAPIVSMPDDEFPACGPELAPTHTAMVPKAIAVDLIKATKPGKRNEHKIITGAKIGTDAAGNTIAVTTDLQNVRTFDVSASKDAIFPEYGRVLDSASKHAIAASLILGVPVLRALLAAAEAGDAPSIRFEVPATDPICGYVDDPIRASWHVKADPDVTIEAIAMPMRAS
jgi:hypothetical protein